MKHSLLPILLLFSLLTLVGINNHQAFGAIYYCSPSGNDNTGNGSLSKPYRNVERALQDMTAGDELQLRDGNYESDEIRIELNNITIKSYPGEWAVITAPTDIEDASSCIWYNEPDVQGGLLENLEIVGGYYYGIKFETNWDWGLGVQYGVRNITIRNCVIHDTGRDCLKITPGCDQIHILNCTIYNSGIGPSNLPQNGGPNAEGIDNVNGSNMIVRNSYFYNISTNGLYAKGGAKNALIEGNLLMDIGEGGIFVGFDCDAEWFDTKTNPNYHDCIDCIVRNNMVVNTGGAGLGFWGSQNSSAYNNTIITKSELYHAPLYFTAASIWVSDTYTATPANNNVKVFNNIFIDQSGTGDEDYTAEVRENSLSGNTEISNNIYFKKAGAASFQYNGNWPAYTFNEWKTLNFETNGYETYPALNAQYHLSNSSPAIDKGLAVPGSTTNDYDGNTRDNLPDIGADEYGAGVPLPIKPLVKAGTGSNLEVGYGAVYPKTTAENMLKITQLADKYVKINSKHPIKIVHLYNAMGQLVGKVNANNLLEINLPLKPSANQINIQSGQYVVVCNLANGQVISKKQVLLF